MIGEEEKIALLVNELEDIRCDFYADTDEDKTLKEAIRLIKASKQEPKTGHWIWELEDWNKWTCSECGYFKRTDIHVKLGHNYCPNCGARMQEVEE